MEEKKELLDQDERVVEIELERLRGFVNHPFKVQADSQMIELQESIKKYGILNPLIVRPRQDGTYEIISGHRRKFAAEKIGYKTDIPRSVRAEEISAEGHSIFKHDPKGKVADAYRVLTKEVLNNAEKRRKHQLEGVR